MIHPRTYCAVAGPSCRNPAGAVSELGIRSLKPTCRRRCPSCRKPTCGGCWGFAGGRSVCLNCIAKEKALAVETRKKRKEALRSARLSRKEWRDTVPEPLRGTFDRMVTHYKIGSLVVMGRAFVHYGVVARLVRLGWRPPLNPLGEEIADKPSQRL